MSRTIVIVGGGFCGTVLAANLLRRPGTEQTRIVLIERDRFFGRGAAYAPRDFPYLLNVTAEKMSAASDSPHDFLEYARRRLPTAQPTDFLPRSFYGEYLSDFLFAAQQAAPTTVRLEKIRAAVTDIERRDWQEKLKVTLDNATTLQADEVILALGNPPPASPGALRAVERSARYHVNPWRIVNSFVANETVLIVGTGLTAADTILAATPGGAGPQLHALSRHGLIPPPQSIRHSDACAENPSIVTPEDFRSARATLRAFRRLAAYVTETGGHWQQVISLLRNRAPQLWAQLSECERGRFLRHVRAYWDVHRHRLPPQIHSHIDSLRHSGRLQVHAGRIVAAEQVDSGICVTWEARGEHGPRQLVVDHIINCTGPDYDLRRSHDPLVQALQKRGMVVPDCFHLGLKTGTHGALLDTKGRTDSRLFYVGPMLRADHWEATAVTELRGHVERLAAHLTRRPTQAKKSAAVTALIPAAP